MSQPSATTSTATTMTEQQSQPIPTTEDSRWDNPTKLANVIFYLTDVAKTWFLNHEEEIPDWDAFTTKLKDIFGTPTTRKENAKKKLETRRQGEETYTPYIEDVLALCRRVNCDMQESERVRNLLKGIAEPAFTVFLVQKPESIADITSVFQHLDEMRTIRVSCPAQNLGEPKALNSELRTLIRDIVREELRQMFNETHRGAEPAASSPDLQSLVRDEFAALPPATLPLPTPAPPTYAEIAARVPSPQVASLQQLHTPPSLSAFTPATLTPTYQSWRPPNRPIKRVTVLFVSDVTALTARHRRNAELPHAPREGQAHLSRTRILAPRRIFIRFSGALQVATFPQPGKNCEGAYA
ncbi:hypothetical protein HPB47_020906 [Ixodes persulcatus]|uniref:Uncharacterized protein n=1 Tax=Ixodes persulcatus TaxID=34615 RepID=A0AC60QHH9_IXOPE|nr:hypothetical protein HPB47_020906 [Ixodes persulcatus]